MTLNLNVFRVCHLDVTPVGMKHLLWPSWRGVLVFQPLDHHHLWGESLLLGGAPWRTDEAGMRHFPFVQLGTWNQLAAQVYKILRVYLINADVPASVMGSGLFWNHNFYGALPAPDATTYLWAWVYLHDHAQRLEGRLLCLQPPRLGLLRLPGHERFSPGTVYVLRGDGLTDTGNSVRAWRYTDLSTGNTTEALRVRYRDYRPPTPARPPAGLNQCVHTPRAEEVVALLYRSLPRPVWAYLSDALDSSFAAMPAVRPTLDGLFLDKDATTRQAVQVARSIYADGRFDDLPILADAMEEAGYTHATTLAHLRSCKSRLGCTVLHDLLLDNDL